MSYLTKVHWLNVITALEREAMHWTVEGGDAEHLKNTERAYASGWRLNPLWHYRRAERDREAVAAHQQPILALGSYHKDLQSNPRTINFTPARIVDSLMDLTKEVCKIDERRQTAAWPYPIVQILMVLGCVSTALRMRVELPWAKRVDHITLIAATALAGLYWLLHRGDVKWIQAQYTQVGMLTEKLRYDLTYYNDQMEMIPDCPGGAGYTPLHDLFVNTAYNPGPAPANLKITYNRPQ